MSRVIASPAISKNIDKYLNCMRKVPFAIGVDDWATVTGGFKAEFTSAYITTSSFDIGTYDSSFRAHAKTDVNMEKKNGGGGMVFTTEKKPTGIISGDIYVWDNNDNKVPVILENTVVDIENGGTGESTVAGAWQAIGVPNVVDNVTTDDSEKALSAAQGKALAEQIGNRICIAHYSFQKNVSASSEASFTLTRSELGLPSNAVVIDGFLRQNSSAVTYNVWAYSFEVNPTSSSAFVGKIYNPTSSERPYQVMAVCFYTVP